MRRNPPLSRIRIPGTKSSLALGHSGPPQTIFRAEDVIKTHRNLSFQGLSSSADHEDSGDSASTSLELRHRHFSHPWPYWDGQRSCLLATRITRIRQEEERKFDRNKLDLSLGKHDAQAESSARHGKIGGASILEGLVESSGMHYQRQRLC